MKSLFLLVVVLAFCQNGRSNVPEKLLLTVYYESKCPDSKKFILEQLVPATNLLKDHLMLHLVPFGKAHSKYNGYHSFQCQHGPTECLGNMVQDCALRYMQGKPDFEKVSYVSCELMTMASTAGDLKCVQNANIPLDLINQCMNSNEGTELQLNSEHATKMISPKFIPTITINNQFNQQIQDHAQVNLVGTLCSLLKETSLCATHYNHKALQYILHS